MSTKGHIYYDNDTECYSDSSDQSVNLLCELSALVEINIEKEWLDLKWKSHSMPTKLRLPMEDVRKINVDVDGLIIEMDDTTKTARKIWIEKSINSFAV